MEPLKEMFNREFYKQLAFEINKFDKNFQPECFIVDVTKDLESLSLNQRMRNTSIILKKHLPADFRKSISILKKTIPNLKKGYTTLVFPDFTSQYGLDEFEVSLDALAYFTSYGSSEFAVREFLKKDFKKTIEVMEQWTVDKNEHLRRLASEASRPRLPWSFKLDEVVKNPRLTQKILEKLKTDESLYVRKSVANHLNDISKDNAAHMLKLVRGWDRKNPYTAWIVKHACRSLIKKGHVETLGLFDFNHKVKAELTNFKINTKKLRLGETLSFRFEIVSHSKISQKLAVDYSIQYFKKSTGLSAKIFKLKELTLEAGAIMKISKKQVFKDFTTRKHYAGKHVLEIIINGNIFVKQEFELLI